MSAASQSNGGSPSRPRTAFVLAGGGSLGAIEVGMLKALTAHGVRPDLVVGSSVGAINGEFWRDGHQPQGDPTGLQIRQGELVSAPCDRPCFWIDPQGQPQATNVLARFAVTWPDGQSTLFGLNEDRTNNGAVLFTAALGTASTKASYSSKMRRQFVSSAVRARAWQAAIAAWSW